MEGKLENLSLIIKLNTLSLLLFRLKFCAQQAYNKMHEYVPCVYAYYQT